VKPWISSYHLMRLQYIPENQGREQIKLVRADKVHVIEEISSRTEEAYNTILEICYSEETRSSLTAYNKLIKYIVYWFLTKRSSSRVNKKKKSGVIVVKRA
jgi:hypothetical protein